MPPGYLVPASFLGQPITHGVNPTMVVKLAAVELALGGAVTLNEPSIGWRPHAGHHSAGAAIDINVTTNPYIVTRTGSTFGGEAGTPNAQQVRQRAVAAFDRAVQFTFGEAERADVSIRVHDTIEVTYDRFKRVSDALQVYFSYAIQTRNTRIQRAPISNIDTFPDGSTGFNGIPPGERWDVADPATFGDIATVLGDPSFQASHPSWTMTAQQLYFQMLRDYEMVRIPFLFGNPQQPITATRNPSNGFLDIPREVVVALVNIGGMRWGASDFGASESGDVMHFDLVDNGGFPPQDT